MTPEQREELRQAAMKATQGPWLHRYDPGNPVGVQHGVKLPGEHGTWVADCLDNADKRSDVSGVAGERNADYIARANPAAILSLIAHVEALTVPQGYKLVPVEPTADMLVAGAESEDKDFGPIVRNCYCAMIQAAPTIPAIPGTKEDATC